MKKFRFYASLGYVNADRSEVLEFPDNVTHKELEEAHRDWLENYLDAGFYPLEEDE